MSTNDKVLETYRSSWDAFLDAYQALLDENTLLKMEIEEWQKSQQQPASA